MTGFADRTLAIAMKMLTLCGVASSGRLCALLRGFALARERELEAVSKGHLCLPDEGPEEDHGEARRAEQYVEHRVDIGIPLPHFGLPSGEQPRDDQLGCMQRDRRSIRERAKASKEARIPPCCSTETLPRSERDVEIPNEPVPRQEQDEILQGLTILLEQGEKGEGCHVVEPHGPFPVAGGGDVASPSVAFSRKRERGRKKREEDRLLVGLEPEQEERA